jgi:hypothetical protein
VCLSIFNIRPTSQIPDQGACGQYCEIPELHRLDVWEPGAEASTFPWSVINGFQPGNLGLTTDHQALNVRTVFDQKLEA